MNSLLPRTSFPEFMQCPGGRSHAGSIPAAGLEGAVLYPGGKP